MIFSILQVPGDRKRLLTASVRHLLSVVYCKRGNCLETVRVQPFFLKENVRYPVWTCRDPISLILGTR